MKRMNISIWLCLLAFWCVLHSQIVFAQEGQSDTDSVKFATEILPIFQERCFTCHGPELQQSNFRIDIKSKAFAGGDFAAMRARSW